MLKLRYEFPIMVFIAGLLTLTACAIPIAPSPTSEPPARADRHDSKAMRSEEAPEPLTAPNNLRTIEMGRDFSQEDAPAWVNPYSVPTLSPTIQHQADTVKDPEPAPDLEPKPEPKPVPVSEPAPTLASIAPPAYNSSPDAIDNYFISGFVCTGSMRPALDCGDEAVFLKPPYPQPPAVGDVVSFSVDISCRYYKSQDISKAHRIIDIRYEGIIPFYTTQGDASSNPDPCELTLDRIEGVLVEVRKGARPQDVIDASEYDLAKLAVTELKAEYALRLDLYDSEKVAYEALVEEYNVLVDHYRQGGLNYQVVSQFYEGLEERRTSLNTLRQDLNDLSDRINLAIDEVDRLYQQLFVS